jgi:hypothetical protein
MFAALTASISSIVFFSPVFFMVSTFLQSMLTKFELKADFHGDPLDGITWPNGDPNPDPSLLLQTWRYNGSHRSGRDPRLAPLTCRLYHTCQFSDGTVVLPESMRRRERFIRACGFDVYIFSFQASPHTIFDHTYAGYDLISPRVTPHEDRRPGALLPHVGQVIFSLFISNTLSSARDIDFRSYGREGARLYEIDPLLKSPATLIKPLLYTNGSVGELRASETRETWGERVITLLERSSPDFKLASHAGDVFPDHNSNTENRDIVDPRAVCYKSIISTGERGDMLPRNAMGANNVFFKRNNLLRIQRWTPVSRTAATIQKTEGSKGEEILRESAVEALNVLVCNDNLVSEEIKSLLEELERRMEMHPRGSLKLKINSSELNSTADSQLALTAFQEADIVLAAHTPLLQNVLYMRPKSVLIEVTPFSVAIDSYGLFAQQLNVSYVSIMARADTKWFKWCIKHSMGPSSTRQAEHAVKEWMEASKRFDEGDRRSHLRLSDEKSPWHSDAPGARDCALQQSLLRIRNIDSVVRAMYDRAVIPRLH